MVSSTSTTGPSWAPRFAAIVRSLSLIPHLQLAQAHIGKAAGLPEHLLLPVEAHGGEDEGDLCNVLPQQSGLARPGQRLEVLAALQEDDHQLDKKLLHGAIVDI